MNSYTIHPLRVGTVQRKKRSGSNLSGVEQLKESPLTSYYLEGCGHKIIVDTGGPLPDGIKWQPYSRSESENLDRALLDLGVSPEDIDIVILTHLHWDHASNNQLFPKARFIAQKKEYDYLIAPEPEVKSGYEPDLVLQTKYELVDGDSDVVEGISVVLAPGHTRGMQCVVVETTEGKYILAGDLVLSFEDWEAVPRIPNPVNYDPDLILESLKKIERMNGTVLMAHDDKIFAQVVYP